MGRETDKTRSDLKKIVQQCNSVDEMLARLTNTDFRLLTSTDVSTIHGALMNFHTNPDIRIAYLGNHTMEPLPAYVASCLACFGIFSTDFIGSYNQHFQEVLDPRSTLHHFDPNLIFLSLSLRELSPKIYYNFASLLDDDIETEFQSLLQHFSDWIKAAKDNTTATLVVCNFSAPTERQMGIADLKKANGETEFYLRINRELLTLFKNDLRAAMFDINTLASDYGKERAFDRRMYFLARMQWQEDFLPRISEELTRYVYPLLNLTRKCLVLDLDNTLWGGIIGEDGTEGLRIRSGDPIGDAYLAFQSTIRSLKERGLLLAIASKNNESDVIEVFKEYKNMPLKLEDFAVNEINWDNKHESLLRIAETLNIGIDSLVFVDDNPAECALIREMLPEVKVVELAGDPSDFSSILLGLPDLEKLSITADDQTKTRQYQTNIRRTELKSSAGSLETYLKNLQTAIVIRKPRANDVARIHQLFNKTNQFNVTTKRYGIAEIEAQLEKETSDIRIVDVRDHFGDLGTVALSLIDCSRDLPQIDSFILSCRAMGRHIETAIMNEIKKDYLLSEKYSAIISNYVPTKKNMPVEHFFEEQGFHIEALQESGEKTYILNKDEAEIIDCAFIEVSTEN